ncbi:hypothetical protein C8Q76DRAFT_794573 [Earliella scabrosa]|nr:hypothetical protein C8Q76DRAFT_794573 [Earliella scabrosa]
MHFAPTTAVTADSRSVRHPSPGSYSSPGLIWHNVCPSSEPPASYGQPMQPRRQTHLSLTSEAPPKALRACVQCAQAGKAHECATNRRTIGCRRCNAQRLGCSYLGGVPASLEDLEVPALLRRVNSALQSLSQQNQVMFDALQHMGARTSRIESHLSFLAKEGSPPFLLQPSSSRRSSCEEEDEYSTPTDGAWEPEVVDPATPSPLVEDTGKTAPPRRKRRRSVDQEDSERVHPRGLNIWRSRGPSTPRARDFSPTSAPRPQGATTQTGAPAVGDPEWRCDVAAQAGPELRCVYAPPQGARSAGP